MGSGLGAPGTWKTVAHCGHLILTGGGGGGSGLPFVPFGLSPLCCGGGATGKGGGATGCGGGANTGGCTTTGCCEAT